MMRVTAILSMLHEPAGPECSAGRMFRDRPVLDWTLDRLSGATTIDHAAVLCWDDQCKDAKPIAAQHDARVISKGARHAIPTMDAVTAARRWADGWRGGPLQTCEFDRGFHGPWHVEALEQFPADAVLLVDPAAGLVDPALIDAIVRHAEADADSPLVFSQAAPGLSGVLIRPELLRQLASVPVHPGKFIHYLPQQPAHDPISLKSCVKVPSPVARSLHRFTLDSQRQVERISSATGHLNGQLIGASAQQLVESVDAVRSPDRLPRAVELELTTRRATRPVFMPAGALSLSREDMPLDVAKELFAQLAGAGDVRLTLGGSGDPLLSPCFFDVIVAARAAGITAIHLRTDLLSVGSALRIASSLPTESLRSADPTILDSLAASGIDLISIQIPATSAATYERLMGVDGLSRVLENVRGLVERRFALGAAGPILVPVFTKCQENLAEMEVWYDKWLAALGSAVIVGANDYAGQIPDHAVADMAPPQRHACGRLNSRMVILSNGKIVACEQDVLGKRVMGDARTDRIADVWTTQFGTMRAEHRNGDWNRHPLCGKCKEWHR